VESRGVSARAEGDALEMLVQTDSLDASINRTTAGKSGKASQAK